VKLEDFVAGGFYINLDTRTDKRAAFENELARVGLSGIVQRLPATTPDHLGYELNAAGTYSAEGYAIACTTSHARAVQLAAELNWRNVLIFEDDAMFYTDNYDPIPIIEQALDGLSDIPWDLFYLGVDLGTRHSTLDEIAPHLVHVRESICAHAYIVNSNVFPSILAAAQTKMHMDCYLSSYDNKYAAYPLCAIQRSDGYMNDIGPNFYSGLSVDYWKASYNKKINKLY
jgi:hypothetical protein